MRSAKVGEIMFKQEPVTKIKNNQWNFLIVDPPTTKGRPRRHEGFKRSRDLKQSLRDIRKIDWTCSLFHSRNSFLQRTNDAPWGRNRQSLKINQSGKRNRSDPTSDPHCSIKRRDVRRAWGPKNGARPGCHKVTSESSQKLRNRESHAENLGEIRDDDANARNLSGSCDGNADGILAENDAENADEIRGENCRGVASNRESHSEIADGGESRCEFAVGGTGSENDQSAVEPSQIAEPRRSARG